jgi:hypothetical protein
LALRYLTAIGSEMNASLSRLGSSVAFLMIPITVNHVLPIRTRTRRLRW